MERARGPVWYAKYGLPDGRQVQKKVGPAERAVDPGLAQMQPHRGDPRGVRGRATDERAGVLSGTPITYVDSACPASRDGDRPRQRPMGEPLVTRVSSAVGDWKIPFRQERAPGSTPLAMTGCR